MGIGWIDDLQSRCMKKPGLIGLGMERACGNSRARGHSNDHIGFLSPSVMDFCQVIHNLIEPYRDKVCKLHLHHGFITFYGKPQCRPDNGTFAKWRISHPISTKFIFESISNFKCPTIGANILAHQNKIGIFFHGLPQSVRNGINESFF